MKRTVCLLLAILMAFLCGCGKSNSVQYGTVVERVELTTVPEALCGYWSADSADGNSAVEFIKITNEEFEMGVYPGECDRPGKITSITELAPNVYTAEITYTETSWYGDEILPQTTVDFRFTSQDNFESSMVVHGQRWDNYELWKQEYTFAGGEELSYENALDNLAPSFGGSANDTVPQQEIHPEIPSLSMASKVLGKSFSDIGGYSLYGGNENVKNTVKNMYGLYKCDYLEFYQDGGDYYYGVDNGRIVLFGLNNLGSDYLVRDFMPDNGEIPHPAEYHVTGSWVAYVWKLSNGYIVLYTVPIGSRSFMNQFVMGKMVYVEKVEWLGFVK